MTAAIAAPVASVVVVVMIAGMCAAVLLTSGRTVGAEQAVIGSIDSKGTRSIVVRADPAAGLDSSVLDRVRHIGGIEWAGAFGIATDVQNAAFPGGIRVPLRKAWSDDWTPFRLPVPLSTGGEIAYGSNLALEQLGMAEPVGKIRSTDGLVLGVAARAVVPEHLRFLEPVLIAPAPEGEPAPVSVLVVIADRPDLVAPVALAVTSVLAVDDPTKVDVQTSEDLAKLRALIEGQLGSFGRGLTLGILALTSVLAAAILHALVMLRRKDFGRRRALGASQRLIILLLVVQVGVLGAVGAAVGIGVALIVLAAGGDPLPGPDYIAGLGILAVLVGALASVVPAVIAARREPIVELRVP
ncbi:ABC transporter permease [Agromyces sp. ZXT2-3]|uniref:ABC transporter permease n=1 Tax=Agromyces sp. ZXT2-3 TaxID=3461152 RepID=UPI004054F710